MALQEVGLQAVFDTSDFAKGLQTYVNGVKEANTATERGSSATAKAGQAASQTGGSFDALGAIMMGVASGGTSLLIQAVGSGLMNAFNLVVEAIGSARSALIDYSQAALMAAGRTDGFNRVALLLGQRMGHSANEVDSFVDSVVEQGIRMDVANNLIANFARRQLDLAQATDLATLAQNAAFLASTDSSSALDTLNTIVGTGNRLMARRIGLEVDFIGAQDALAASLGTTRDALTSSQRAQANLNALLEEGQSIMGVYGAAMGSPTKNLGSLERQLYNLQVALGGPFIDGWNNLVQLARTAVSAISDMVSEGGSLYPVLINLGAAFSLLTEALANTVERGIGFIQEFSGEWIGNLSDVATSSAQWGINIVVALADGIITAAAGALTAAMNFVGSILSFWLAPGSPPRIAPDLPSWGASAMNEYLEGFTEADFDILTGLQSILRNALEDQDFADVSQELARVLTEGADEDFFTTLAQSAGQFGSQIAELVRLQFDLADATEAVKRANEDYSQAQQTVSDEVREYNDMLRAGASEQALAAQLDLINAAEAERDAAAERANTANENIDALEEEASLQEQLIRQLQMLADIQEQAAQAAAGGGGGGAGGGGGVGGGVGAGGAGIPDLGGALPEIDPSGITTRISEAIEAAREILLQRLGDLFAPLRERWEQSMSPAIQSVLDASDRLASQVGDILRGGGKLWTSILSGDLGAMSGWWEEHGDSVSTIISGYREIWSKNLESVLGVLDVVLQTGLDVLQAGWELHGDKVEILLDAIGQNLETVFDLRLDFLGRVFDGWSAAMEGDWRQFGRTLGEIWNSRTDLLSTIFDTNLDAITEVANLWIEDFFKLWYETDWESIGIDIIQGIGQGISNNLSNLLQIAQNVSEAIDDVITGFWETQSPSKRGTRIGGNIGEGLGLGMLGAIPELMQATSRMAIAMENAIASPVRVNIPAQGGITQSVSNIYHNQMSLNYHDHSNRGLNQQQFNQMANRWLLTTQLGRA